MKFKKNEKSKEKSFLKNGLKLIKKKLFKKKEDKNLLKINDESFYSKESIISNFDNVF